MRIGFDAKRLFNNSTGLGNYSRFVLDGLSKYFSENEYILYTPKLELAVGKNFNSRENIKIVQPQGIIFRNLHTIWRSYEIDSLAKKDRLNIYHGLSNELPIGIEKTGVKSVVTIHDLIFKHFPQSYSRADLMIYDRKFSGACARADKIIAASIQTKNDIVAFYKTNPDKIEVVYQDCDEVFSSPADESVKNQVAEYYELPEKYILMVSKTDIRKNHISLLKAFKKIQDTVDYTLVMIGGEGDTEDNVAKYIRKNNIRVKRLNNISHPILPYIYDGALFTVYPSIFEGFGIPILESIRRGKPVLTNKNGCFKEVAGDAGRYVDVLNPQAIAEEMLSLIEDTGTYQVLQQNCKVQAEKFNAEKLTKQLHQLYQTV
ncbi:MAG: glycosyltransferase family 4 protein [Bacteroidetes bacterium]|nr:glycosyltransferase family 4 protein [Bacteroidota bacterium]